MATAVSPPNPFVPSDVHPLDIVGETCDVLQLLPRDKLADTLLVLGFKYTPDRYFILYQLEIGDVYAKFAQRSMSARSANNVEKRCEQLCGGKITQGAILNFPHHCNIQLLMSDGSLFVCVIAHVIDFHDALYDLRLKRVPIQEAVVSIASGDETALAITSTAVYECGDRGQVDKLYEASGKGWSNADGLMQDRNLDGLNIGDEAPCQVTCFGSTSNIKRAILLRNGNVVIETRTGWVRPSENFYGGLGSVEQIGSTKWGVYALANGVLYVMEKEKGSHFKNPKAILFPGDSKVTSFRCHKYMVVAQMDTKETYYWGTLADGMEIEEPQPVPSNRHPRDMFGLARNPATEGVVYLGKYVGVSKENERDIDDNQVWLQTFVQLTEELVTFENPVHEKVYEGLIEQLKKKFSNLQSEKEQYELEKTKSKNLERRNHGLRLEHDKLKKKISILQSEKEQLDTNYRELELKYSASLEFAAVNMVAREITVHWRALSLELGLNYRVIEEIDRYGNAQYKEKALLALSKWEKKFGEKATKKSLIAALDEIPRKDIADELRNM